MSSLRSATTHRLKVWLRLLARRTRGKVAQGDVLARVHAYNDEGMLHVYRTHVAPRLGDIRDWIETQLRELDGEYTDVRWCILYNLARDRPRHFRGLCLASYHT